MNSNTKTPGVTSGSADSRYATPVAAISISLLSGIVSVAAVALAIVLAGNSDASAQASWRGPPKISVMSELEYMRVDGIDFKVGDNALEKIETVGLVGRWGEFELTYAKDTRSDRRVTTLRVHLDNIQIYIPKDVPHNRKSPKVNNNSNEGG